MPALCCFCFLFLFRRGTINTAYSHFRILSATLTMLVMLYISELVGVRLSLSGAT